MYKRQQFYVDAQTFRVMGGEALSRWKHPSRGLLTPSAFIPLFEREGLIYKLDYYCLEESCRCLQTLLEKGMERFFISCNFSRETFAAEDFVSRMRVTCVSETLSVSSRINSSLGKR